MILYKEPNDNLNVSALYSNYVKHFRSFVKYDHDVYKISSSVF